MYKHLVATPFCVYHPPNITHSIPLHYDTQASRHHHSGAINFAKFFTKNHQKIWSIQKIFVTLHRKQQMVSLAQLVRASDCGSEGRGFDPHTSPSQSDSPGIAFFISPPHQPPSATRAPTRGPPAWSGPPRARIRMATPAARPPSATTHPPTPTCSPEACLGGIRMATPAARLHAPTYGHPPRVRGSRWRGWVGRGSGPSWRGRGCGSGWLRARGRR